MAVRVKGLVITSASEVWLGMREVSRNCSESFPFIIESKILGKFTSNVFLGLNNPWSCIFES